MDSSGRGRRDDAHRSFTVSGHVGMTPQNRTHQTAAYPHRWVYTTERSAPNALTSMAKNYSVASAATVSTLDYRVLNS